MTAFLSLIFGALLCSPIGPFWVLSFGGGYVPEIIFVLMFFVVAKSADISQLLKSNLNFVLIIFAFCFLFFLFGILNGAGVFYSYSDFRASFLFLIVSLVFYKIDYCLLRKVSWPLFCVCIFSMISGAIYYKFSDLSSVKNYYPFMVIPLVLLFSFLQQKRWMFFVSLMLVIYVCVSSFYRSSQVIAALSIVGISWMFVAKKGIRSAAPLFLIYALLGVFAILGWSFVENYFISDESRYIHSIGKWEGLVDSLFYGGEAQGGDDIRLSYLDFVFDNFLELIVPFGFGYKSMVYDIGSVFGGRLPEGNTIDGAFLYIAIHFGTLILCAVFALGVWATVCIFKNNLFWGKLANISFLLVLVFYFSITGVFFTEISSALFTGATLGLIFNKGIWTGALFQGKPINAIDEV